MGIKVRLRILSWQHDAKRRSRRAAQMRVTGALKVFSTPLALAISVNAVASGQWQLEKDADGVRIETRDRDGAEIREIRGAVLVPARLSAVVAVIADVGVLPQLSDVVAKSELLQRKSEFESLTYSVLKMPWPLDDRDLVNRRFVAQDTRTFAVSISDTAAPDAVPARNGRVRIRQSRQLWCLKPQPGGVQLEMRAFTDPAGPIPASLINAMSVGAPYAMLRRIRAMAQSAKYRDTKLEYVQEPLP